MSDPALPIITPDWPAPPGVRAAFTLRQGGVSPAPFDSLNVGLHTGDVPEAVEENRRRVRAALQLPAEPFWLTQVHGAEVVSLDGGVSGRGREDVAPDAHVPPPRADAVVTRTPGRVCVIQVADCMPVLFAARDGTAVGAAHAGWRGLAAGVLRATVDALGALAVAPADLLAWLGPAIGPRHFEVGDEVRTALLAVEGGAGSSGVDAGAGEAYGVVGPASRVGGAGEAGQAFVRNSRGRWQCDLYAIACRQLEALGVRDVYGGGWCTYADSARFFSYRRDGRCGRMAALVWIEPVGGDHAIRRGLMDQQRGAPEPRFVVRAHAMGGLRPGIDPLRLDQMVDELEVDAHVTSTARPVQREKSARRPRQR